MKKNKKKLAIISVFAALVIVAAIGTTVAFLTDDEKVENTFTVGDIDVSLEEPGWNPNDGDGLDEMPGDTEVKDPTIKAEQGDSYMRVKVTITDKDGNALTDTNTVTIAQQVDKIMQTVRYDSTYSSTAQTGTVIKESDSYEESDLDGIPTVNSVFVKDETASRNTDPAVKYYNYTANNGIFEEGTEVVLFTNIVIPSDWTKEDLQVLDPTNKGYKITVEVQAIQTANIDSANEAYQKLDTTFND